MSTTRQIHRDEGVVSKVHFLIAVCCTYFTVEFHGCVGRIFFADPPRVRHMCDEWFLIVFAHLGPYGLSIC